MGASQSFSRTKPKPGDLIVVDRGNYKHWAVYIGEDVVVHLVPNDCGPDKTFLNGEVKCEKLSDVLKGDRYQVNNLLDDQYKPRDPEVIVQEACRRVDKKLMYNVVNYNTEHFATEMRYGKPESRQSNMTLKPGDLIDVNRGNYSHWAIYTGGNEVVHLVTNDSGPDRTFLNGEVKCENLRHVLVGDRYRVNNLLDDKYKPRDPEDIVKEAKKMVGHYVVKYNAEQFSTELRYGKRKSRQAKAGLAAEAAPFGVGAVEWISLLREL